MALNDCIGEVIVASGGKLTRDEASQVIDRVRLAGRAARASGDIIDAELKARELVKAAAEGDKIKAALQRKQAALNAIRRTERDNDLRTLRAAGMTPMEAMRTMMRGSMARAEGARRSVSSMADAYYSRYLGKAVLGRITTERPHLERMLSPGFSPSSRTEFSAFWDRVGKEMWERFDGGKQGVTGDKDARWMADTMGEALNLSKDDLNRLGANIGELDGYGYMPQYHDAFSLVKAPKDEWIKEIGSRLNMEKSFPDATPEEAAKILSGIYDTIVTGKDGVPNAREKGEFSGPSSVAKKMGEQRTLHFKSYDDYRAYSSKFGSDNVGAAVFMRLKRASRMAGMMHMFGPNPGQMLQSMAETERANIRSDQKMDAATRNKWSRELQSVDKWASFKVMMGQDHGIVSPRAAGFLAGLRSIEQFSKLGGAVISALLTDPVMLANNLRFHGMGASKAYGRVFSGYFTGRGKDESRRLAFLAGEGFDGLIDAMSHPLSGNEGTPGFLSRLAQETFRITGMTWQFDAGRAVASRILQAELGEHAGKGFDALDIRLKNVLNLQGISPEKWEVLRKAAWKGENGAVYLTPDKIADISDAQIDRLIANDAEAIRRQYNVGFGETAEARAAADKKADEAITSRRQRARIDLELDLRRYIADEASFGILRPDDAVKAYTTGGHERGTVAGEAIRLIMQFKAFPIAFTQRVLGRSIRSGPAYQTKAESILRNSLHMGELLGTLLVAGMATSWMKDVARGNSPKEIWNEGGANWKTIGAAFAQSGGAGIYGDFLFGSYNRFGGGWVETAAGPSVGSAIDAGNLVMGIRDAGADPEKHYKNAQAAFRLMQGNLPFVNMWYTKAATDYLFMNAIRESILPGYLRRQERQLKAQYGQERLLPAQAFGQ